MDVRADSAIARATGAVHAAATLCGLSPSEIKMERLHRKSSQANSQIQYRFPMGLNLTRLRRAAVKAGNPSGNQFGSGTLI